MKQNLEYIVTLIIVWLGIFGERFVIKSLISYILFIVLFDVGKWASDYSVEYIAVTEENKKCFILLNCCQITTNTGIYLSLRKGYEFKNLNQLQLIIFTKFNIVENWNQLVSNEIFNTLLYSKYLVLELWRKMWPFGNFRDLDFCKEQNLQLIGKMVTQLKEFWLSKWWNVFSVARYVDVITFQVLFTRAKLSFIT